ncbi:S-formylglutathione hydrolase [Myxococcus virescens]|uniref:S-formylglutathione hydrolase n=1 Tax=Myxococcus virescens TaxID=83456 RepID=A0A511HA61_9BACT|nr:S-formylglutathione hydrolase [Myxococcus virescens]GEL70422.1 S-formylglutathione hydrolase [Myxococcus virescens]SDE93343.1 S-formylglutathione hydrolase [Myxococcus virescens]
MERIEHHASFGGRQEVWKHTSSALGGETRFGIYLPEAALRGERCPVLYWLSGLTCTEQNFITKAGAQEHAARHGFIVVAPDTSPRGDAVANDAAYDLGQGAGFYLDATQAPWAPHFRMQDYVARELPALVEQHFPATDARGIFGHSMGGHGALVTALRHPGRYRSVSAFSPIVAPSQVPWGQKAFTAYLGDNRDAWAAWDAVELVKTAKERLTLLVDQGEADEFLATQLRPELLAAACEATGHPLTLRRHAGYDHSYYFIATFLADHFAHHAKALVGSEKARS